MLALAITAELEGVTNLRPVDTEQEPFEYEFKVQCTSCREVHPNWVRVNRFDKIDLTSSRGDANFVWRCKLCRREHSATIMAAPMAYEAATPAKLVNILEIDCRGLEFVEFKPSGTWAAEGSESGSKFNDIALLEGEWYDYDEKAGEEVSIKEVDFEIRRA